MKELLVQDGYKPRLIDEKIKVYLKLLGAISIEGPKWCGKTWTALAHSRSFINLDNPRTFNKISEDIDLAFQDDRPQLIDEWVLLPEIWDAVRRKCDETSSKGNFILTCSTKLTSVDRRANVFHSGAGRFGLIKMRPMSLFESGDSTGDVSLKDLFDKKPFKAKSIELVKREYIAYLAVRGGWPGNIEVEPEYADILPQSYIENILNGDIAGEKSRNIGKMRALLKSLARLESQYAGVRTIERDIDEVEDKQENKLSHVTIDEYIDLLQRLNIIEDRPPFRSNYRASKKISTQITHNFVDPSLPCALLDMSIEKLVDDTETFGFIFESLVVRDLRVYAETFKGSVLKFKDHSSEKEVDAIVELKDGRYAAIEIKLSDRGVNGAIENLQDFYNGIKKKPEFMAVIVGVGDCAYKDKDSGVYVIPITMLRN